MNIVRKSGPPLLQKIHLVGVHTWV